MVAWNVLPVQARRLFQNAVGLDEATWLRGRGWALAQAVVALPYYRETNPGMAQAARHALSEVLSRRAGHVGPSGELVLPRHRGAQKPDGVGHAQGQRHREIERASR